MTNKTGAAMGTSDQSDYGKEWFAQAPEELPLYVRLLDAGRALLVGAGLVAFVLIVLLLATACASFGESKEERLADKCFHFGGKASISYAGDTGRVECR